MRKTASPLMQKALLPRLPSEPITQYNAWCCCCSFARSAASACSQPKLMRYHATVCPVATSVSWGSTQPDGLCAWLHLDAVGVHMDDMLQQQQQQQLFERVSSVLCTRWLCDSHRPVHGSRG